uniref:ATP synthase F0 subunit 8 n=1 Tax=Sirex nitobei TaxID=1602346 RepID=UPI0023D7D4DB|nr:ATP synthase F0 subunit 8 [Sirex nitobei]WDR47211.1 ATP synthase F0 subunit 8 [Sirex nitobei]
MPQMSPLNWKFNLFFFNLLLLMIFNMFFPFIINQKFLHLNQTIKKTKNLSWKW